MVGTVSTSTRWLLLCALVFAVVAMHHLAATSHGADHGAAVVAEHCCETGSDHEPAPPPADHDVLHLCLAVLLGLLVMTTALVAWRTRRSQPGRAPPRTASWSPPPPLLRGGRATLHSVCVLRL